MLNPEIKTKWLEALRSGKYQQDTGTLRYDDKFCCLGVLCDIIHPTGWNYLGDFVYKDEGASGLPPSTLCEEIGLPVPAYGLEKYENITNKLAGMNDNGQSFEEIADFIEANL